MQPVQPCDTSSPASWITLWSLREDTLLEEQPEDDSLVLRSRWGDLRIPRPGPVLTEALRRMLLGPIQLENVPGTDELPAQLHLLAALRQLGGLVVRSVGAPDGERPLLSVVPTVAGALLEPLPVPEDRLLRLSRFAALRSTGRDSLLESPLSSFCAVFTRPEAGWLLASLGRPVTVERAVERLPIDRSTASALVAHLVATGMVEVADQSAQAHNAAFDEDRDPALVPWSHHDLWFHWSSRPGLHDRQFGATYRLRGRQEQPPVLKPVPAGQRIPLPRPAAGPPDWDITLAEALERRRSVRRYGADQLTLRQLGELLHHSLRVRETDGHAGAAESPTPQRRPYPSGGACYELECYLTIGRCADLEPGSYYYDPLGHALIRLSGDARLDRTLLCEAQVSAGAQAAPDVLITLTARFARVSWKYSGLAYALTLKHVGVVQQTLYLLATGMGLAGCALGTGPTGLSAEAFGLDWRVESAVGEFVLGSLPDEVTVR
ncbi:SagB family peptide dehydrogenase [Kitasatospora kifunensis]|uniref:SagB-type dehydrogenase family enzyme n=1 Tax=Kitasatospora kifunensis TaxID=58351 RepID=A0A7W7VWD2_KITKI|nr:SagB family peptide dehydrogenase [Kitasatospora kifunensis]MBB4924853.1 SagB-type dehydrogenase family enzyme [Kitasatospora kifunensis]